MLLILYILVSIFHLHFDWLLAYEEFVIGLNSDLKAVDTRFLHVNMTSFLQIIVCSFCCRENKHGGGRTMKLHKFKKRNHHTI